MKTAVKFLGAVEVLFDARKVPRTAVGGMRAERARACRASASRNSSASEPRAMPRLCDICQSSHALILNLRRTRYRAERMPDTSFGAPTDEVSPEMLKIPDTMTEQDES